MRRKSGIQRNTKESQAAADLLVLSRLLGYYCYLSTGKRDRTVQEKAPLHPPLPPAFAGMENSLEKYHAVWKNWHGIFTGKDERKFCYSPYNGELYMSI